MSTRTRTRLAPYVAVWDDPHRQVKGIYVGSCVNSLRSLGTHHAHAHAKPGDSWCGWICVRHAHVTPDEFGIITVVPGVGETLTTPGPLAYHELAHLIEPTGHSEAWAIVYAGLLRRAGLSVAPANEYLDRKVRNNASRFTVGQRVRIAAHAKPAACAGLTATIRKVGRTRVGIAWDAADIDTLGPAAKYNYWPAGLLERLPTPTTPTPTPRPKRTEPNYSTMSTMELLRDRYVREALRTCPPEASPLEVLWHALELWRKDHSQP